MNDDQFAKLYPEGRTYYNEGDPEVFMEVADKMGLEPTMTVHVPPERIGEFLRRADREKLTVGT